MTNIVGLVGFIRKLREAHDPVKFPILNPKHQGVHYFFEAVRIMYDMQPVNMMHWNPNAVETMLRGKTFRDDIGFAMMLVDSLLSSNREQCVQDLLAKVYWLCQHADGDAVYTELLGFYERVGTEE